MERINSRPWKARLSPKHGMGPISNFISVNHTIVCNLVVQGGTFFPYRGFLMRSPNKKLFEKICLQYIVLTNRVRNESGFLVNLPLGKTPRSGTNRVRNESGFLVNLPLGKTPRSRTNRVRNESGFLVNLPLGKTPRSETNRVRNESGFLVNLPLW